MCGERGETVQHKICECKKLAQREYKRRHDTVAKLVHWKLCDKYNLERKVKLNVGMAQKSVLLGTARILRKVLDM